MRLKIKVIAGAKKESVVDEGGKLKVKLAAPPVKGKANVELIKVLSDRFNVPKSRVRILKWLTSNIKEVEIC